MSTATDTSAPTSRRNTQAWAHVLMGVVLVVVFLTLAWLDWADFKARRQQLAEATALHGASILVAKMQTLAHLGELFIQAHPELEVYIHPQDPVLARARLDLLLSQWFPDYRDYRLFPRKECPLQLAETQASSCAATESIVTLIDEKSGTFELLLGLTDTAGAAHLLLVEQSPTQLKSELNALSLNGQQVSICPKGDMPPDADILAAVDIPNTGHVLAVRTLPQVWAQQRVYIAKRVGGAALLVLVGLYGLFQLQRRTERLEAKEHELEATNQRLFEQATHDPLTGLYNRYAVGEHYHRLTRQSQRQQQPMAVLLIDIDHFKQVNDQWGHEAGDVLLRKVAEVIGDRARRPLDMAARLGGEEFAVLLEGAGEADAWAMAELLRLRVADLRLPHPTRGFVSVSIGVASSGPELFMPLKDLLEQADRALYAAKHAGRNRVIGAWEMAG
jgi:diguanylate cyclase (GGDEF)-like protein